MGDQQEKNGLKNTNKLETNSFDCTGLPPLFLAHSMCGTVITHLSKIFQLKDC